ncbi:TonB-dependent receptor [Pseudomaricurvus alcaniphilus]|uniref:TonB-dependent receptor n=1 Tax=Pseudomaricurvus alcaniphilus TaxID=1166482 RepID=UPI00140BE506|nr:TonB-dependent receptor [Pseudomaricurvus alcaniphilus]NHN36397.1 TonB-dependent receptor [Pseudomaricurvus alcaniphilus]
MPVNKRQWLPAVTALAAALAVPVAHSAALEEIIVTAQKREQNLQNTPIAISAFDAAALEQQGISDIEDVSQYVPNVQIVESPAGSTGATIAIRGSVTINPAVTWEPTVGIYMDGVFIAKNAGGIFDVAELDRVEVLRGPQGSLYGKNTVGGAINLITRKPSGEFGGRVQAGFGSYGERKAAFSIDSPVIADIASFNLAFSKKTRDGLDDNTATGEKFKELDNEAGRLSALVKLRENVELQYSYDWSDVDNTPSMGVMTAAPDYRRPKSAHMDGAIYDRSSTDGHSVHLNWELPELTIKSITAYREMSFDDTVDLDGGSPFYQFHTERHIEQDQLSQEFQFIGSAGKLDYVAGIFYFDESAAAVNPYDLGFATVRNFYSVDARSYALYGHLDWHVTERLTLSGGLRWTEEEKDFQMNHPDDFVQPFAVESSDKWSNFSPSLVASYAFSEQTSGYAKLALGWKSGGFNGESENLVVAQTPYDEEEVTSFELGVKSRLLDERLQINAAVFQNEIEGLQLSEFLGASGYSQITNAGEATVTGLELEVLAAISETLRLNINYGYLDPEYDMFVSYGTDIKDVAKFPYAPENTYSIGLEYNGERVSARLDYSYTDDHDLYHEPASAALTAVEGYALVNARVSWNNIDVSELGQLKVALWAKNLTDEEYYINGIPFGTVGFNYFGNPRMLGLDVSLEF